MAAGELAAPPRRTTATPFQTGLLMVVCADVIRPALPWMVRKASNRIVPVMPPAATRKATRRSRTSSTPTRRDSPGQARLALGRITMILACKGGLVRDITVGDYLDLLDAMRGTGTGGAGRLLAYRLLHALGHLGPDAPVTGRAFLQAAGQRTVGELVDRYQPAMPPGPGPARGVPARTPARRGLHHLVQARRRPGPAVLDRPRTAPPRDRLDQPGARDRRRLAAPRQLPAGTAARRRPRRDARAPRGRAQRDDDSPRVLPRHRPVGARRAAPLGTVGGAMPDQGNRLQPGQARQARQVPDGPANQGTPPAPARPGPRRQPAPPGQRGPAGTSPPDPARWHLHQQQRADLPTAACPLRLRRKHLGQRRRRRIAHRPDRQESEAFWAWAFVEVLRHSGIRFEELRELSHHSITQYRLPSTGELVPLLQIAPSKTGAERLLLVSPELADVLSAIVARIRGHTGAIPLVPSYDIHEKTWNPPMPLLFQRAISGERRPISDGALREILQRALAGTGIRGHDGQPLTFTPHDFRRIFVTDAIMNGLPPHIAQVICGHRDISTTMGYKAIYPAEAIEAHRAFIARRRQARPSEEYRTPTDEEWDEFLAHFEKRKLSTGTCARAFGTPCIHEHACIRCPMLRPDPAQRGRLEEIRDNLLDRIAEAEREGWHGEAEGLQISLTGARDKLSQIAATRPVNLGIPAFHEITGRHNLPG